jgi:hypothetical protein
VTGVTRPCTVLTERLWSSGDGFVASSHAKDAVVADPDQPVISASPASFKRVIPPGEPRLIAFLAVGCAVRWLAERRPDPHHRERHHDEGRDDKFAPHGATVATVDGPMVTDW